MEYITSGDLVRLIQLQGFRRNAKKLFRREELEALIGFLGDNPERGDVIPGTGGLRKLRWASGGKGKRGGSRVIYYYHRPEYMVLLLAAYAKNQKDDLSVKDKETAEAACA